MPYLLTDTHVSVNYKPDIPPHPQPDPRNSFNGRILHCPGHKESAKPCLWGKKVTLKPHHWGKYSHKFRENNKKLVKK